MRVLTIAKTDPRYSKRLKRLLRADAPERVTCVGNFTLLDLPRTALFCSAQCPGSVILNVHDQAAQWRDEGRCIISGFHSPVEKDCLQILLRGRQPIIICPARAIDRMRLPAKLASPMKQGRLLFLSFFGPTDRRVTRELAAHRNNFVAALADEVVFAYVEPGGRLDDLRQSVDTWGIPIRHLNNRERR
jgi:predicted Rossmann fold nucleotide-binding protein DprA/Smf involved in DNA uptake